MEGIKGGSEITEGMCVAQQNSSNNGSGYFMEWNGTLENMSSTSPPCWYPCYRDPCCWDPCCWKELALNFYEITWEKLAYGHNSNTNIHVPTIQAPACQGCRVLSSDIQLVEIGHCSEDLHSCSVFPSAPLHSVK